MTLTLGLVLGLGYHNYPDMAVDTFAGLAISEAHVITQPMQATRDREEYARRFGGGAPTAPAVSLHFGIYPGGLAMLGKF